MVSLFIYLFFSSFLHAGHFDFYLVGKIVRDGENSFGDYVNFREAADGE